MELSGHVQACTRDCFSFADEKNLRLDEILATAVLDLISRVKILLSLSNTPWVYEITTK
jgi:hypothetical protein